MEETLFSSTVTVSEPFWVFSKQQEDRGPPENGMKSERQCIICRTQGYNFKGTMEGKKSKEVAVKKQFGGQNRGQDQIFN